MNSPDHGEIVYDVNKMKTRQPESGLSVIGGLVDHSNVAVFGKDETNVKDLLKCDDFKQLTVWSDQDKKWEVYKQNCFLTDNDDRVKLSTVDSETVGGIEELVASFSGGPASYCDTDVTTIQLGSEVFSKVMVVMEKIVRFSTIFCASEKITAMVRLPLCLRRDQIDMKTLEQLEIPFDVDGKFIILH